MTDATPTLFAERLELTQQTVALSRIKPPAKVQIKQTVGLVGVLQPVLLKPCGEPEHDFEIADGERRTYSALHFGLTEIPAVLTDGSRAQMAAARAIANNDRSDNPVQEARAYRLILDEGLYAGVEDMARDLRVPVGTVKRLLRLAGLPDDLLDGVQAGKIGCGTAEKIANFSPLYRDRAISVYRTTVELGGRFTNDHLKEVRARREGDLTRTVIGALADVAALTPLISLPPAQVLAEEVRLLAHQRGVALEDLVQVLRGEQEAAPKTPPPAEPPSVSTPPAPRVSTAQPSVGAPPAPRVNTAPPRAPGRLSSVIRR